MNDSDLLFQKYESMEIHKLSKKMSKITTLLYHSSQDALSNKNMKPKNSLINSWDVITSCETALAVGNYSIAFQELKIELPAFISESKVYLNGDSEVFNSRREKLKVISDVLNNYYKNLDKETLLSAEAYYSLNKLNNSIPNILDSFCKICVDIQLSYSFKKDLDQILRQTPLAKASLNRSVKVKLLKLQDCIMMGHFTPSDPQTKRDLEEILALIREFEVLLIASGDPEQLLTKYTEVTS